MQGPVLKNGVFSRTGPVYVGGLLSQTFLGGGAELVVQGVCLFKEFLTDAVIAHLGLFSTGALDNLLTQIIVQVYGLINEVCNLVSVLSGIHVQEKRAVIHKCTYHILDVFLDVSEVHGLNCFAVQR